MRIVAVRYEALVSLGNYENEKVGLEAQLGPDDDVEQSVEALKTQVFALLDRADALNRRNALRREIATLEVQVREARESWEKTAEFLRAQGLRPDAPGFPDVVFRPLLPAAERAERIYGEVVDDEPYRQ